MVSLLTDVSSEMIFTLVPLFLTNVLGAATTVVGLVLLTASLLAGWLWDAYNPAAPFYLGAGLAFVAMLGIMTLIRE
jgi:hypothetical protein